MTFSFANVDRGIYEAIRLKCVALGYLPDRTLYLTADAYAAAKQVIRDSGKQIIEVYGIGDIQARDELEYNSIIINRDDITPGSVGMFGTRSFVARIVDNSPDPDITVYDVYLNQSGTVSLQYQISYITDDSFYDRLVQSIVFNALKIRGYVYGMNDDGTTMSRGFNTLYRTTIDKSGSNFIERGIRYDCLDIAIEEATFLYTASQGSESTLEVIPASSPEEAEEEIN